MLNKYKFKSNLWEIFTQVKLKLQPNCYSYNIC